MCMIGRQFTYFLHILCSYFVMCVVWTSLLWGGSRTLSYRQTERPPLVSCNSSFMCPPYFEPVSFCNLTKNLAFETHLMSNLMWWWYIFGGVQFVVCVQHQNFLSYSLAFLSYFVWKLSYLQLFNLQTIFIFLCIFIIDIIPGQRMIFWYLLWHLVRD